MRVRRVFSVTGLSVLLGLLWPFLAIAADEHRVEPTDKEVEYMKQLDSNIHAREQAGQMGDKPAERVDPHVVEKPDGSREIHMDYDPGGHAGHADVEPPAHDAPEHEASQHEGPDHEAPDHDGPGHEGPDHDGPDHGGGPHD